MRRSRSPLRPSAEELHAPLGGRKRTRTSAWWSSLLLLLALSTLNVCWAQSIPDIHVVYNATGERTHLRGIRRIPPNLYSTRAPPPPMAAAPHAEAVGSEQPPRAFAPPLRAVAPPALRHVSTPPSFPITTGRGQFAALPNGPATTPKTTKEERRDRFAALAHPRARALLAAAAASDAPSAYSTPRGAYEEHVAANSGRSSAFSRSFAAPTAHSPLDQRRKHAPSVVPTTSSPSTRDPVAERQRRIQKAWTHPTTAVVSTTTPLPARSIVALSLNEGAAKHAPTPLTQFAQPEAVRPSFSHRPGASTVTAAQMAFRSTQPTVEPTDERVGSTSEAEAVANNNIRRQSLRTGSSFTSVQPQQVVPSAQPATWESLAAGLEKPPPKPSRAFGERTQHFAAASRISFPGRRITGPILAPLPEDSGAPPTGGSFGHARQQLPFAGGESGAFGGRSQLPVAQPSGNEEGGPTIVPDFGHSALPGTNGEDYHHRQSGMRAEHRFKLVSNRLVPRPRLKIRTHDEPRAQGDSTNSKTGPISLPELATFDGFPNPTGVSPRRPLPTAPTKTASSGPSDFVSSGRPRHVPRVTAWGDEDVEAIRGGPRPTAPTEFAAPTEETTGESGANFGGASPPATEDTGGDSAVGFGAPVGTPPPGFSEAFGLNGASMPLDPNADLLAPAPPAPVEETPPPTQRPRPRPTTTNAAPVVVPENSGLRPATPPKEFQGGFGSSGRGSPFGGGGGGGFGGGSGGIGGPSDGGLGGAAVEPTPAAGGRGKGRKRGRKGGRQPPKKPTPEPAPELKEEDFFTGESALTPNVRGPTGDGYGPPVLPGSAIPPAVPALSAGGTAAGIPPAPSPPSSYQGMSMDVTENTPTTVKPSALLNILNRADQSFNQMLTNFESGAPLESAAIDILEVALGSQKLDSQAKLLGHVDRTFGLDNLQRLQRWANTGGALDEFKEQLVKVAKNFKPPPETNAITIPPQLEYLFQSSG